ncbi:MAG TPA: ATP-dependent zinc metalloprotease FtsH [Candidatus Pelethenecus faecipullorum]|uniref:ATP-dependent zinc metalloprotease FtsH n=1 Tax=Candidatus Pelethenecus faecipullorum TaxID=2840900 RepID=A0A9D1GTC4_9MOLU|nr:ATP-dependent zinc metalloprotease FtsH [Candidatus Pelethenecus faecipullorum]
MQQNQKPRKKFDFLFYLLIIVVIIGVFLLIRNLTRPNPKTLTYADLVVAVEQQKIDSESLSAQPAGGQNYDMFTISGRVKNAEGQWEVFYAVVTMDQFNDLTQTYDLAIVLNTLEENIFLSLLISLIPYIILIGFFIFLMRSQGNNKAFDFAKSTARLSKGKTVTFNDVAGCDEEKEELVEIIDFLKNPRKYAEIGARIPKGVLLFGPPGTGKTLLAKAVAGEANVPFFSISGSDFVEMFVGVGASRVRDMFKTAKENAPCIIFIDEIDAVGRQRGAGMGGGHDEREQTLNQLLVEMDGFNANLGIIVMAATNRPDVLDPALLRPGRFDRQITISNPDVNGRTAILRVHARNKHLDPSVKLDEIACRIPGFSGADIENLLNEAALLAARDNRKVINTQDIDEAIDRVMMGPAKKTRKITEKEKILIAHHEAGHAIIGLKLDNANIVQKVTIIPRGQAGGYALMLPEEERYLETKQSLLDRITGYLGGRVSEEINFHEVSTGASNDFQMATKIARAMVTEYGMSELGPVQYEQPQGSVFLGRDYLKEKNFSDQIALEIDKETRRIVEECYERARKVITENLDLLKTIADYLIKVETLTKSDIDEIEATGHLKRWDDLKAKPEELPSSVLPDENSNNPDHES